MSSLGWNSQIIIWDRFSSVEMLPVTIMLYSETDKHVIIFWCYSRRTTSPVYVQTISSPLSLATTTFPCIKSTHVPMILSSCSILDTLMSWLLINCHYLILSIPQVTNLSWLLDLKQMFFICQACLWVYVTTAIIYSLNRSIIINWPIESAVIPYIINLSLSSDRDT